MPGKFIDVRMHGFRQRTSVNDALLWLDRQIGLRASRPTEKVPLGEAAGRVLSGRVTSPTDVPRFDRAMMDGYAVHSDTVAGASVYNRLALREIGVSLPGQPFPGSVERGAAVRIMTGAPLPSGTDCVLPVECTQRDESGESANVLALGDVPPGKHVGTIGEDVRQGDTVLETGRRLRPQDIGVLASIGVTSVETVALPQVKIVVTGNELVSAGAPLADYQISDANGPMLAALARRDGAHLSESGIVPDDYEAIRAALHAECDIVLVSGGSSCGQEDHAPSILASDGELAIHGIAMRPSSPTGMGTLGGRLVFLLPGNPVSCLCAYDFFAGRAIRGLAHRSREWPYRAVDVPLARKLVSQIGRTDYARVRLVHGRAEPLAVSGASILTSTTRADGFVVVDPDSEGFAPGSVVRVWLFEPEVE